MARLGDHTRLVTRIIRWTRVESEKQHKGIEIALGGEGRRNNKKQKKTRAKPFRPVERGFLLAVGGVSDGHSLLAALRVHGRDVEDEVGVADALAGLLARRTALLALRVAHPTILQNGHENETHCRNISIFNTRRKTIHSFFLVASVERSRKKTHLHKDWYHKDCMVRDHEACIKINRHGAVCSSKQCLQSKPKSPMVVGWQTALIALRFSAPKGQMTSCPPNERHCASNFSLRSLKLGTRRK